MPAYSEATVAIAAAKGTGGTMLASTKAAAPHDDVKVADKGSSATAAVNAIKKGPG